MKFSVGIICVSALVAMTMAAPVEDSLDTVEPVVAVADEAGAQVGASSGSEDLQTAEQFFGGYGRGYGGGSGLFVGGFIPFGGGYGGYGGGYGGYNRYGGYGGYGGYNRGYGGYGGYGGYNRGYGGYGGYGGHRHHNRGHYYG